jgi:hypothetical protein
MRTKEVGWKKLSCDKAQELMSSFIDSMTTPDEGEALENHLFGCEPCQRQLQSFISLRSLLTRIEHPKLPEDLVLETRVKLSHARNENFLRQLETRVSNFLKPVAIPAFFGVSLTMLFFGILLGSLVSNTTVMAQDHVGSESRRVFQPVRTTDPTMIWFAASNTDNKLDEPLMIETHVGDDGRVMDYQIISGPQNPELDRWLSKLLYFAKFTPATAFGKPVDSKIILSFVAVRS